MRIRLVVPDASLAPALVEPALETVTRLNERDIRAGRVPHWDTAVSRGVKWRPEPPGDEHFDAARTVVARRWGDCDDLAPYAAASMRASGEDPDARVIIRRSGPKRWHAVVACGDGSIRDPSREAGMGSRVDGAYVPPTRSVACLGVAGRRWRGTLVCRAEAPFVDEEPGSGLAVHAQGRGLAPAVHALHGAATVADVLGERDAVAQYRAVRDMLCGVPPELASERHGVDGWGAFSSITSPLKSVYKGAASAADPFGLRKRVAPVVHELAPLAAYAPIPGAAFLGPLAAEWASRTAATDDPFGAVPVSSLDLGPLASTIRASYMPSKRST